MMPGYEKYRINDLGGEKYSLPDFFKFFMPKLLPRRRTWRLFIVTL